KRFVARPDAEVKAMAAELDQKALAWSAEHAPIFVSLEDRMLLGFRILLRMMASYRVFLDENWATDTYTGSFSGRNFNSGPRDSNEWEPLSNPSEKPDDAKGPSGEGTFCAHVDVGNLLLTL